MNRSLLVTLRSLLAVAFILSAVVWCARIFSIHSGITGPGDVERRIAEANETASWDWAAWIFGDCLILSFFLTLPTRSNWSEHHRRLRLISLLFACPLLAAIAIWVTVVLMGSVASGHPLWWTSRNVRYGVLFTHWGGANEWYSYFITPDFRWVVLLLFGLNAVIWIFHHNGKFRME